MQRSVASYSARRWARRSSGFTLVELLVVITIIGILMGLLLPAVNSAREAARNNTCQNNLHQMGLAALAHEQAQGYFPTGGWGYQWVGDPDAGFGVNQPGGWIYNILPYLDQRNLHDQGMGQAAAAKAQQAAIMVSTPLALFYCPTRRPGTTYPFTHGATAFHNVTANSNSGFTSSAQVVGRSDYAANGGSAKNNDWMGPASSPPPANTQWPNVNNVATTAGVTDAPSSGVCYVRSMIKTAHITDGPSNTYLFGEKFLNPDNYSSGADAGDDECAYVGWADDICRTCYFDNTLNATNNYAPRQDIPVPASGSYTFRSNLIFGSPHPAGCNFVFCDGSVHSISFSIDPLTHNLLSNRADNQPIDDSKWR